MKRFLSRTPAVIAHRGASGWLPDHTLAAYDLAIEQRSDAIELDVVSTRDGMLIARHENELSVTTDVAALPQFAARQQTRIVDGQALVGWFAEDFTLAETKTLRCRQALPFRDQSHNGLYPVPTLAEVLAQVEVQNRRLGRDIGVLIEIKHASYFAAIGLALDEVLLRELDGFGSLKICVQSFEVGVLKKLRSATDLPLMQLLGEPEMAPFDFVQAGDPRRYAELLTPAGLAEIAVYADGIAGWMQLFDRSELIKYAHEAGLAACAWSFQEESAAAYPEFFSRGIDGVITDFPDAAVAARSASLR